MYDMYPEWGPAAHDPEHPLHAGPSSSRIAGAHRRGHRRWDPQSAPDLRDAGGDRPDDN